MKNLSVRKILQISSVGTVFYTIHHQKRVTSEAAKLDKRYKVKTRVVYGIKPESNKVIKLTEVEVLSVPPIK